VKSGAHKAVAARLREAASNKVRGLEARPPEWCAPDAKTNRWRIISLRIAWHGREHLHIRIREARRPQMGGHRLHRALRVTCGRDGVDLD